MLSSCGHAMANYRFKMALRYQLQFLHNRDKHKTLGAIAAGTLLLADGTNFDASKFVVAIVAALKTQNLECVDFKATGDTGVAKFTATDVATFTEAVNMAKTLNVTGKTTLDELQAAITTILGLLKANEGLEVADGKATNLQGDLYAKKDVYFDSLKFTNGKNKKYVGVSPNDGSGLIKLFLK